MLTYGDEVEVMVEHEPEQEVLEVQKGIEEATEPAETPITAEEWTQLKTNLDKRYTEIATLLRYNKTREDTIQRLNAEVQKYREGFAFSALKPFITTLISFREECRKGEREIAQYADTEEKAKKCIDFLVDDFQQMLINLGLECSDGTITLNGRPLTETPTQKIAPTQQETEQPTEDAPLPLAQPEPVNTLSALFEYLTHTEGTIKEILEDKATTDQTIHALTLLAKRTDAEYYTALVAPIARQVYTLGDNIPHICKSTDIPPKVLYDNLLTFLIHKLEVILTNAGVQIESTFTSNILDTQKHKIQKTVTTTDEALDRTIANNLTDCYIYEGKVIYQSKVDVYKYQNQTQGE